MGIFENMTCTVACLTYRRSLPCEGLIDQFECMDILIVLLICEYKSNEISA